MRKYVNQVLKKSFASGAGGSSTAASAISTTTGIRRFSGAALVGAYDAAFCVGAPAATTGGPWTRPPWFGAALIGAGDDAVGEHRLHRKMRKNKKIDD